ncbi:MAG: DNA-binding response regulator, partial [bacterium]
MPRKTGVQVAKALWAQQPNLPIIFWSNYADEAYVRGIARIVPPQATYGYILKTASRDRLL